MIRSKNIDGARRTERECYSCENGNFLQVGSELVCENCQYSPDGLEGEPIEDPWEVFWSQRKEYSGFYGPKRVKMVGGFARSYLDD